MTAGSDCISPFDFLANLIASCRPSFGGTVESTKTRDEILKILQRRPRADAEIAEQLAITPAGIRMHLNYLEREGYILRRELLRRGTGQPAIVYGISEESEDAFSSAYRPMRVKMLSCLPDTMSAKELKQLMTKVGTQMAQGAPHAGRTLRDRIQATVDCLEGLGAQIDIAT
ncbi:MAG: ArsR family transcriptional regulator [Pseudomonadota bacterium]